MILVIPALELSRGRCIRCIEGEPGTEQIYHYYSESPVQQIQLLRRENSKSLQITDTDSYSSEDNSANTKAIIDIAQSIDIPITLLAALPTVEQCRFWLHQGIYRIIISRIARTDPEGVRALTQEFSASRIAFGIRADGTKVTHHHGLPPISTTDFVQQISTLGGTRIVYSDIHWEGQLSGPNQETLKQVALQSGMRVTAAGGIANVQQLLAIQELAPYGVDSVVIGRALYENRFPCQKIWRLAEAAQEPEFFDSSSGREA